MPVAGEESLSMFGARKPASELVLRTTPSILATDFLSGSGMRREELTFGGSGFKAALRLKERYEFDPQAHPSPNAATSAPAMSQVLRPWLSCTAEAEISLRL
jgi:hypothetical protein